MTQRVSLVGRPVETPAQAESRTAFGTIVWEDVAHTSEGRAWQWRAWYDGEVAAVVTWDRFKRSYLACALGKRIGYFRGSAGWRPGQEQAVPPSWEAVDAVTYTAHDFLKAGEGLCVAEEALLALGDVATPAVRAAYAALEAAFNARYDAPDEGDVTGIERLNVAVQAAISLFEEALFAAEQAAKTPEEKSADAAEAIKASAGAIEAFNASHASRARKGA